MARDIAFVADKDTRDDFSAYGETPPHHEVPRSEGRPADGDGRTAPVIDRAPAPDAITEPDPDPSTEPDPSAQMTAEMQATEAQFAEVEAAGADASERNPAQDEPAPADLHVAEATPNDPEPSTAEPSAYEPVPATESELAPEPEPAVEPEPVAEAMPPVEAPPPALPDDTQIHESETGNVQIADLQERSDGARQSPEGGPCWRSAIADALADPPAEESDPPAPETESGDGVAEADVAARAPEPPEPTPDPELSPEPQPPPTEAADLPAVEARLRTPIELLPPRPPQPTADTAPPPAADPAPVAPPALDANAASPPVAREPARAPERTSASAAASPGDDFTQAAQDLFRPQTIERDPHMITLGRRLDPSILIPRPTAPVIETRVIEPSYEPVPEPARPTWKTGTWKDRLWIAGRYAAYAAGGYMALVVVLILLFRFVDPPGSMLMLTKLLTGNSVTRSWVPLDSISPNLVRAVIVSEDGRFCEHSGVDTVAIRDAIERASGGIPRGASTISMQLTKNLFLWNAKSYIRKIIEVPLTLLMELVWPKWRILEIYLNVAEWGPGVFGAEAAARHHFNKPASRLNEREAALLAAVLPNPVVRDAGSPNTLTSRKARVVQSRVKAYGAIASCVVSASTTASSPAVAPAATGAAPSKTGAAPRNQPARKPAPRKAPRQETIDDWAPVLRMGPQ